MFFSQALTAADFCIGKKPKFPRYTLSSVFDVVGGGYEALIPNLPQEWVSEASAEKMVQQQWDWRHMLRRTFFHLAYHLSLYSPSQHSERMREVY